MIIFSAILLILSLVPIIAIAKELSNANKWYKGLTEEERYILNNEEKLT